MSLMYVPISKAALFLISFHIFSFDGAFINLLRVSLNTYYTLLSVYFEKHQKFQIFHMSFFSLQSPLVRRPFVWPTWIYACGAIWGLLYLYANPENKWYSTLRRCEGEKRHEYFHFIKQTFQGYSTEEIKFALSIWFGWSAVKNEWHALN